MHWFLLFPSVDIMKRKRWEGLSSRIVIPFFLSLSPPADERREDGERQEAVSSRQQSGGLKEPTRPITSRCAYCITYDDILFLIHRELLNHLLSNWSYNQWSWTLYQWRLNNVRDLQQYPKSGSKENIQSLMSATRRKKKTAQWLHF